MREAADETGFPGGRNKFYAWMRKNNFLDNKNYPARKLLSNGWLTTRTKTIYDGWRIKDQHVVFLTQLGLEEIGKLVKEQFKDTAEDGREKKSIINLINPNSIIDNEISVHKTNI